MPSTKVLKARAAAQVRQRKGVVLREILVALIAIVLAFVVHEASDDWTTALAVALFVEILSGIYLFRIAYEPFLNHLAKDYAAKEHPFEMLEELADRTIPLQLLTTRPPEWVFQERFDQIIASLRSDLKALTSGTFSVLMEDVQDISFDVCKHLADSAFCTAPSSNLSIFNSKRGMELKRANFDAAERLQNLGGFTRLFIFRDMADVTPGHYNLMRENENNSVKVLVALESDINQILRDHDWEHRSDFGLWDGEYLMTIVTSPDGQRMMEVTKNAELINTARILVAELEEEALTWEEFDAKFREPINTEQWSTTPATSLLRLPPPNGPSAHDCKAMCEKIGDKLGAQDRIAIYGLTGALIDAIPSVISHSGAVCDVVDARFYSDDETHTGLNFVQENWLTWQPEEEYWAVLGDDVVPNLGVWQIPLFFSALHKAIKPGGRFITRTTAMYSPDTMHPRWSESINKLRQFNPADPTHISGLSLNDLTEGVVYEVAWPTLHSAPGFYDPQTSSLDIGEWDKRLAVEQGATDFLSRLRLQYSHHVTSVKVGDFIQLARPYFQVREELPVHSVWESEERLQCVPYAEAITSKFREYYRILVFERMDSSFVPRGT